MSTDSESDISEEESSFRRRIFPNHEQVLNLDIKCTVCNIDLMWMLLVKKQVFKHPLLEVIICEGCSILCSNPEKGACAWCCRLKLNETCYQCVECAEKFCSVRKSEQEVDSICAICMGDFENKRTLPCEHQFHSNCLEKWLEVNRSCPVCRSLQG